MATDPVCGMSVEPGRAAGTAAHGGSTYYFCSAHCKSAFERDPVKYLGATARSGAPSPGANMYTCSMHPEVRQAGPGSCPKCGMALEPESPSLLAARTEYVCPMHPEIVRDQPGDCPICGMALEPRTFGAEEANPELEDMSRRFWVSAALALPLFVLAMVAEFAPQWTTRFIEPRPLQWLEFALATPVVLWGGWPFFVRGWQSLVNRHLNMFTLIALGVGVAWLFSVVGTAAP
ncbi:MAG: YHS domain-containing protein, partial [Betaproteobacteria bacterium]|nr:YHS domain-containing protein [Betaproteobacteria bacterium]